VHPKQSGDAALDQRRDPAKRGEIPITQDDFPTLLAEPDSFST
jgi:hypothetical protein